MTEREATLWNRFKPTHPILQLFRNSLPIKPDGSLPDYGSCS
jgi:hypothetical protein